MVDAPQRSALGIATSLAVVGIAFTRLDAVSRGATGSGTPSEAGMVVLVALVWVGRVVPETKGRTLEEIEQSWDVAAQ
ncbi:MAG: hypothetical protein JJU45_04915 [Acidimicrobiia bacterium]|nr:hypothetical protein [Acidimicrobiia bacterium]